MKKYDAIVFDIDGVILDTTKMNMIPLQKIIKEELDIDISYEEVLKYVSYPGMKVMEELKITNKEEVYDRWVKYVNEYEEGATLYEGMEEVLIQLSTHTLLGIVSSKTKKQYQIDIVDKGFDCYFKEAILLDDTLHHKPHPEPLLKCIEKLNLSVNENNIVYIGDAISDYKAAKAINIDFAYAAWGSISNQGIDEPTYYFDKPIDLLKLIKKL